jgi:hypothetical protein
VTRPVVLSLNNRGTGGFVNLTPNRRAAIVGAVDRARQLDEPRSKARPGLATANLVLNLPKLCVHARKLVDEGSKIGTAGRRLPLNGRKLP